MMTITIRKQDSIDIVTLTNRLIAADVNSVRNEVNEIIKQGSAKLILDMKDLQFVDSSGLGLLVGFRQEARKQNGDLVLLDPQPEVMALLEMTRLDQVFSIFNDQSTAVASLSLLTLA